MTSVLIELPFYFFGSQASGCMSHQLREQLAQSCGTAKPVGSQAINMPVLFPALCTSALWVGSGRCHGLLDVHHEDF